MKPLTDKANVVKRVCEALSQGDKAGASEIAQKDYPFVAGVAATRKFNALASTRLFIRDGFVDRYSGTPLIFPGVLRLLSTLLPNHFPAHKNWKMKESHLVYYELFPTIDHVVPIARGGADIEENWVTTSMILNNAKANWTLEELGWTLQPAGAISEWDGMLAWFVETIKRSPEYLSDGYIRKWHAAATKAS